MCLQYIGDNIKKARMQNCIKQRELCSMVKISQTHLSLIESGKKNPSLELVIRISEALKIDPSDIVSRNESYKKIRNIINSGGLEQAMAALNTFIGQQSI